MTLVIPEELMDIMPIVATGLGAVWGLTGAMTTINYFLSQERKTKPNSHHSTSHSTSHSTHHNHSHGHTLPNLLVDPWYASLIYLSGAGGSISMWWIARHEHSEEATLGLALGTFLFLGLGGPVISSWNRKM